MTRPRLVLAVAFSVLDNPEAPGGKAGIPIYRGSKARGTREFTGRVNVIDKNHKAVSAWRESVFGAARPDGVPLLSPGLDGPLIMRLMFSLNRPKSVSLKSRPYPTVRPDVDNLSKGTIDAITNAGLWRDDALLVSVMLSKAYCGYFHVDGTPALEIPGCVVQIYTIMPPSA